MSPFYEVIENWFVSKKIDFEGHSHLQFALRVLRLPNALSQGQQLEVPLYFEIFNIKVDVQTIWDCFLLKRITSCQMEVLYQ